MNAAGYVLAAYAVFVGVMAWDFLAPRLQVRRVLRRERARAAAPARRERRATDANALKR